MNNKTINIIEKYKEYYECKIDAETTLRSCSLDIIKTHVKEFIKDLIDDDINVIPYQERQSYYKEMIMETITYNPEIEKYREYITLKRIGMLWEFYPEATGNWREDRVLFIK
jgi:hypothetical protein